MPATTSSEVNSATRGPSTLEVDAASVSVARDGGYFLLLHTTAGVVRFHVPLAVADPIFRITNPAVRYVPKVKSQPRPVVETPKGPRPETLAMCEAAWASYVSGEHRSLQAAAFAVNLSPSAVTRWVREHHAAQAAQIRQQRKGQQQPGKIAPEKLARYEAIRRVHEAPHERGAVSAACLAQGISMAAFYAWRQSGTERAALAAAREPITKPSGQLL